MAQRLSQGKLLVLVCLLTIVPAAFCQGVSGHIIGTVQDTTNAVIPNAQVTITNQDTGIMTHTKSNAVWRIPLRQPAARYL